MTAEELFLDTFIKIECHIDYDKQGLEVIKSSMKQFAKYHVQQALKAANSKFKFENDANHKLILNAYSLDLIK